MASSTPDQGPIFIGGTGRSGTSIMGDLLNSHPDIVLPAHENKLIVEKDGLRDVVAQLGGRFDIKRHHYAVANFIRWARKLHSSGFRDPALNEVVNHLTATGMDRFKAYEVVARDHPAADLSIHAIAEGFGYAHFDSSVNDFLHRICGTVSEAGIVDTEGLISPFITPEAMDRAAILRECRTLLDNLYAHPMRLASASRWCDDTPSNWMYLDFLHELYPNMKFIHMIRDPRDVVGSYMKQIWASSDPNLITAIFKAQFSDYEAVMALVPSDRVKEIRLEDISSDKSCVLEEISAFLGVENKFDGELFFNEKVNTGSYAETIGEESTKIIECHLSDWMIKHNYLT